MKPAKLIEISEENRVHDLTRLLSDKPKIVIGRRNLFSDAQADILLGEDENGKPNTSRFLIHGVSRRQAIISHEGGNYYIKDCSTYGTTRMNDELLGKGEKRILERGVNLFFGKNKYGPVIFWQDFAGNSDKI